MSQVTFQAADSPVDSSSDYDSGTVTFTYNDENTLNSKITVAAIIVLILALSIIFTLHFLTRWMHRRIYGTTYTAGGGSRGFATTLESLEAHRRSGPNQGLDKASIESLPTFAYKQMMISDDDPQKLSDNGDDDGAMARRLLECSVCLSEFQENEILKFLPACKHTFHTECIDMWFFSHSTCPLCRTLVSTTDLCPEPPTEVSGSRHHHDMDLAASSSSSSSSSTPPSLEERSVEMESLPREPNSSHHNIVDIPASLSHGNSVPYPSNVLFWGNENQTSASHPSSSQGRIKPPVSISGSRSGKRDVRPISIQIPSRHHDQVCVCSSPAMAPGDLQSCSSSSSQQPQSARSSSPSIRSSIKRMLSRQSSRARVSQVDASDNMYSSPKDTVSLPV